MGLVRKQPFLLPLIPLALVLIILASVTMREACWLNPNPMWYSGIPQECPFICDDGGNGIEGRAFKYLFINGEYGNTYGTARCPWKDSTGRIFVAFACLAFVWGVLELLLVIKRKFFVFFNIILILVIGLGCASAAKQLDDIHHRSCDEIENQASSNTNVGGGILPPVFQNGECNKTIYVVSFILVIVALVHLLAQLIWNIINVKRINEKEVEYQNVPQSYPAHAGSEVAPATVTVTETNVVVNENRIA